MPYYKKIAIEKKKEIDRISKLNFWPNKPNFFKKFPFRYYKQNSINVFFSLIYYKQMLSHEQKLLNLLSEFRKNFWGQQELSEIVEKTNELLESFNPQSFFLFLQKKIDQPMELLLSSHIPKENWPNIKISGKHHPIDWVYRHCRFKILRNSKQIVWPFSSFQKLSYWILAPIPILRDTRVFPCPVIGVLAVASNLPLRLSKFFVAILANHIGMAVSQSWLYQKATLDSLCQIYCRGYFLQIIADEISQTQLNRQSFSLLLMDLDHFKDINDNFNHLAGDQILQQFSFLLQKILRPQEIPCRYGGEEFMLFIPKNYNFAMNRAEEIRQEIAQHSFFLQPDFKKINLTLSIGVSMLREGEHLAAWIDRTDQALYLAKASGRNCVIGSN